MECLGKTCRAAYNRVRRLPNNSFDTLAVELVPGAGEGIRTPDPLITNQMLYRLSYASNWGKARLRANLSHGSLPDVRDNYIKYHSVKMGCNKSFLLWKLADFDRSRSHPIASFISQGNHWIYAGCTPCWNRARRQCDSDERQPYYSKGRGIPYRDTEY
jgi:hypothetical protein